MANLFDKFMHFIFDFSQSKTVVFELIFELVHSFDDFFSALTKFG